MVYGRAVVTRPRHCCAVLYASSLARCLNQLSESTRCFAITCRQSSNRTHATLEAATREPQREHNQEVQKGIARSWIYDYVTGSCGEEGHGGASFDEESVGGHVQTMSTSYSRYLLFFFSKYLNHFF